MKLAPKLPAAYENQVLEFHSYVTSLQRTHNFELSQIATMDEVPLTFGVHPTELWTSKEQRPRLFKRVVRRKHISLLFKPVVQMGQSYHL